MKVVSFLKVKDELIKNMRRNMLIPIIGSGFTRNCSAYKGTVPSGEDYRKYMISQIQNVLNLSPDEKDKLNNDSFSSVSEIYYSSVSATDIKRHMRNNFTKVSIDENKKQFLSLDWPYIYTLNIDDGIENNSDFSHVIYSNRPIEDDVFDSSKCVIKLHGDIYEMTTYKDSQSEILTQRQYVDSLKKNMSLLSKLKHDSVYQNLIFIGCSLDDEIDLLVSVKSYDDKDYITAKYICVVDEPTTLDKIKYKQYGITHCVKFDSFDEIYNQIYRAGLEAQKISVDDLENYKSFSIKRLSSDYDANKPYLLFGKSLVSKNHEITLPYFFISRKTTTDILSKLSEYPLQFLVGSGCSGKTYALIDVACKIKDKDVFFFETKDRLSNYAFDQLIQKKHCVILADNTAFSSYQLEYYIKNLQTLKDNDVSVVVAVDKNNRDLNGILKLYELQGLIKNFDIPQILISNTFDKAEIDQLNPLLTAIDAGIFDAKKTLVDNIIYISNNLEQKSKYHNVSPRLRSVRELAALIALATERKIYSSKAAKLELDDELLLQCKVAEPLIDREPTWSFETSFSDNPPMKYIVNAEYWLSYQLGSFANSQENYTIIVEAYKYIIARILSQEGHPDLLYGTKSTAYKDYILFDNINRIFKAYRQNGLFLIRSIYEGLNELLSVDPNYMHQRAKCYIKSAFFEKDAEKKVEYLDKSHRDANVAFQIFNHRFEESGNEKLLISIAHVKYTQALVWCHKCYIHEYRNVDENTTAVNVLHEALVSPYNSYAYAKKDSFNYNDVIAKIVQETIANRNLVNSDSHHVLTDLLRFISNF